MTAADLATDSVTSSEIATDAVGSAEIAADAVGSSELANNSVGTGEVTDGSLTSSDIFTMKGTVSIDPGNINSQRCSTEQAAANAVPGIQVGDTAIVIPPATIDASVQVNPTIQTTANTLTVRFCNIAPGAVNDPAGTYTYLITR